RCYRDWSSDVCSSDLRWLIALPLLLADRITSFVGLSGDELLLRSVLGSGILSARRRGGVYEPPRGRARSTEAARTPGGSAGRGEIGRASCRARGERRG